MTVGPNSQALIDPLEARVKHLEEFHHIIPPLATAMVVSAEALYRGMSMALALTDDEGRRMLTHSYLAQWASIGAAFGGIGTPMGLSKLRVYDAARYTIVRTIKENAALDKRLYTDPAFARDYAEKMAGAEMERLLQDLAARK